jgi:hypothetical protein
MPQDENITARWRRSPWKEAADFLAGSRYKPEHFRALLKELYPQGGEIRVSQTHRGRAALHDFRGIDLTGRDLTGAYFDHFDLSGGVCRDTRVSRALFDTAQLIEVIFYLYRAVYELCPLKCCIFRLKQVLLRYLTSCKLQRESSSNNWPFAWTSKYLR